MHPRPAYELAKRDSMASEREENTPIDIMKLGDGRTNHTALPVHLLSLLVNHHNSHQASLTPCAGCKSAECDRDHLRRLLH